MAFITLTKLTNTEFFPEQVEQPTRNTFHHITTTIIKTHIHTYNIMYLYKFIYIMYTYMYILCVCIDENKN